MTWAFVIVLLQWNANHITVENSRYNKGFLTKSECEDYARNTDNPNHPVRMFNGGAVKPDTYKWECVQQ